MLGRQVDGYVAVTDPGWYEHLSRDPGPKDANFWRPSARAFRLGLGTPFLFKLKAPHHAIAGFGYFAGFTILPDWLAWDTFGEANGVAGLDELRGRLSKIQKGARIEADPGGRIGCCLIAESVFFKPDEWVVAPRDWKRRTQTGARYDLSVSEGLRVWTECLARASGPKEKEALAVQEPVARTSTTGARTAPSKARRWSSRTSRRCVLTRPRSIGTETRHFWAERNPENLLLKGGNMSPFEVSFVHGYAGTGRPPPGHGPPPGPGR